MAKPEGDDAEIDTMLKESHRCAVTQRVRGDGLAIERGARSTSRRDMFRDQPLEGIRAHSAAIGTREHEILWAARLTS